MDEKISLEAISLYGDAYAEKVLKDFFSTRDKITGTEILSLCNVHQVNLFVIRELFRAWKEETKKVKSPYFDYENPEVKDALENFMGVLSKNILIDRAHFAPLLKKASSQALLVIFDPYDFYAITITGKNNKLEVDAFREEIRYLKVNKAPLDRMLQRLEEKGIKEISGNEAFAELDHVLEEVNFAPEDVEEFIRQFNAKVKFDPAQFYVPKNPIWEPTITPVEKKIEEAPKLQEPAPVPSVSAAPQPKVHTAYPNQNISTPSVNEKLQNQGRPTLVDNFKKISKIKDSLTINQKFMFTKVLFHGDFELFSKAIDRL
ncbi:MAG: hypothetical protein ACOYXT_10455, partial [Bacteroidota bacterium]